MAKDVVGDANAGIVATEDDDIVHGDYRDSGCSSPLK
jgi:hypothetical protein